MIQFNLLPDVKINLIKARRVNRLIIMASILAVGVSVLILGVMFSLSAAQKKHINDLNKDISSLTSELQGTESLTKILTVQNQLKALPALYAGRPAVTRLPGFLDQATPSGLGLGNIRIDFSASTFEISGASPTLELVNRYVDTLKFTTYTVGDDKETKTQAFNGVVLSAFSKNDTQTTFTIQLSFDPVIFDASQEVSLVVPTTVTTRSQTSAPANLFNGTTETENQ
jgi:hypothetical protein